MKIGFIGAGNMATAIAKGMIGSGGYAAADIIMSDPAEDKLAVLSRDLGVKTTTDNSVIVATCDLVILAVKPQMAAAALHRLTPTPTTLFVSILAGISTQSLAAMLPPNTRIVRVMPNTPLLVSQGMSALCAGEYATDDDMAAVKAIFDCAGKTVLVNESQIDAIGAISGCGPAYFFMILEALSDAGVRAGLPRPLALELATQTAIGSAVMVAETGKHPAALKDMVTSPAGTTIEAVNVLESYAVRAAFMEAVDAAIEKTKRLA
ncbi:MAG: pyrroline-5-carboxylate reductase [Deferribacteraceae bacterium]|jgi:pyrroline-5-carboxylate reductase|nr:pyrroline-5-carboxylate reductase [Deferribacteraceae bacterium]